MNAHRFLLLGLFLLPALALAEETCGPLRLTQAAAKAGISFRYDPGKSDARHLPETMGAGLAWLDYDGDGWQDLYVVQSGPYPPPQQPPASAADRLFRNRGDGTFEDVTARARIADKGYGQGVVAADVDGDGDTDLYLTNAGPNVLLVNRGDGTFEDGTKRAGLAAGGWSSSAAFADADADGDLDLYIARYIQYDPAHGLYCGDFEAGRRDYCDISLFQGEKHLFFRNRGDGTFEEATDAAGFGSAVGRGLGVVFTDLDDDRRPDLYVANDLTGNMVFRNKGDGTFEDVSLISGAAVSREGKSQAGMGVAAGDFDGDGDPDLTVTNFDAELNSFYRNLGALQFEDVSSSSGFGPPDYNLLGFGIVASDLDLDGDLDFYIANGHVFEKPRWDSVIYAQPDLILTNDGRGKFENRSCALPPGDPQVGRGLAGADYDNDGRPDLAMQNSGGPLEILRNEVQGRPWIGIQLDPEAVGTRLTLVSRGRRQVRWVTSGDSYQSASDRRLVFGLPDGDAPAEIEVVWPSGKVQRIAQPSVGSYLVLRQP